MDKQIEEMARTLCSHYRTNHCKVCDHLEHCMVRLDAEWIYSTGYRKQSEGEWIMHIYNDHCSCGKSRKVARYECSACKRIADMQPYGLSFCPNCGAKMKGE